MFSNYYHLGDTIELFNLQNKNLCSKWYFEGKYSKLFDPSLKCYEMILSTGNLSKMLIPKVRKNSKIKTLSLFQGYIVFQIYLFTSKQFSIELAISDTTNAKRRFIFSSNNDNLILSQLHCRIPIFELPIGRWINLSIDILSFVSFCFKNLTFRSVDYISLSMSGKVRYIFTMRTPLIDNRILLETENKDDYELDDCGNKISENSVNSSFIYGAQDIPKKYRFPEHEFALNLNINYNYIIQQISIQNQIRQFSLQQKLILNDKPRLIQDTADASNMDKGLKFRYNIYMQNRKKLKDNSKYLFEERFYENPFINYNNIDFDNEYGYVVDLQNDNDNDNDDYDNNINNNYHRNRMLSDGMLINENEYQNYRNLVNNNMRSQNQNSERLKNIGNLIVSQDANNFNNHNNNENFINNYEENNNGLIQYQGDEYRNNRYGSYNSLANSTNNQNNININDNNNDMGNNNYIFFDKDEYNKIYNSGKGVTKQINQNLNLEDKNENDDKYNNNLSTIKNENENNNAEGLIEEEKRNYIGQILEDSLNLVNQSQNNEFLNNNKGNGEDDQAKSEEKRPFSPPITKIEDGDEQEILV